MNAPRFTPAERLIIVSLSQRPGITADELASQCLLNRQYIPRLLRVLQLTGATIRSNDGLYALSDRMLQKETGAYELLPPVAASPDQVGGVV
jgi:DNA-binding IclR family transcriptional regulator